MRVTTKLELYLPVDMQKHAQKESLQRIAPLALARVRARVPGGYGGLRAACGYRWVDVRHNPVPLGETAFAVDMKPRIGGRVHPLYHIAEGGRKTSNAGVRFANYNKRGKGSATANRGLFIPSPNGVLVTKGKYAGQRGVFVSSARGYAGRHYLRDAIYGGKSVYAREVYKAISKAWTQTRKVT